AGRRVHGDARAQQHGDGARRPGGVGGGGVMLRGSVGAGDEDGGHDDGGEGGAEHGGAAHQAASVRGGFGERGAEPERLPPSAGEAGERGGVQIPRDRLPGDGPSGAGGYALRALAGDGGGVSGPAAAGGDAVGVGASSPGG